MSLRVSVPAERSPEASQTAFRDAFDRAMDRQLDTDAATLIGGILGMTREEVEAKVEELRYRPTRNIALARRRLDPFVRALRGWHRMP